MIIWCEYYKTFVEEAEGVCPNHTGVEDGSIMVQPRGSTPSASNIELSCERTNIHSAVGPDTDSKPLSARNNTPEVVPPTQRLPNLKPPRQHLPRLLPAIDTSEVRTNNTVTDLSTLNSMIPPHIDCYQRFCDIKPFLFPFINSMGFALDSSGPPFFPPESVYPSLGYPIPHGLQNTAQSQYVLPTPGQTSGVHIVMPRRKQSGGQEAVIVTYNPETREFKRPVKRRKDHGNGAMDGDVAMALLR